MDERAPVLIAGAGIAGLALALALAVRRFPSVILERREALSEAGAGIQLGPNAVHVLDRLGVAERLKSRSGRPEAIIVADGASGRTLGRLPLGTAMERRHGAPYLVAHRVDLQNALVEAVQQQPLIRLITGWAVSSWQETDREIVAHADNGAKIGGSALIGADGIWSTVRRKLHPDHPLTYSGKMAARTVIPMADISGRFSRPETGVWLGRDAHVVHYPIRANREIAVVAIVDEAIPREDWGYEIDKTSVLGRLRAFAPELLAFLNHGAEWHAWSLYDPLPLPSWSHGRVTLMGDAAHPILPFLAQGGAMAIEDAETLAKAMTASADNPHAAFAAYENARKSRVARVQMASRENGRIFHLGGAIGAARDLVLSAVPGAFVMRRYDWLYGWDQDPLASR